MSKYRKVSETLSLSVSLEETEQSLPSEESCYLSSGRPKRLGKLDDLAQVSFQKA